MIPKSSEILGENQLNIYLKNKYSKFNDVEVSFSHFHQFIYVKQNKYKTPK